MGEKSSSGTGKEKGKLIPIEPDIVFIVPNSYHTEKIAYFFREEKAQRFAESVGGELTVFCAPVHIKNSLYRASVRYKV